MHPYTLVKNSLRSFGVFIFRAGNLPRHIDLWVDIKKLQFARAVTRAFPSATVHSFEPVSDTFAKLKEMADEKPNIHPHQLAFGEKSGTATVHLREQSGWNSLSAYNNSPANSIDRSETVTISTVDSFCSTNNIPRIDLLKTDTEGFDNSVLLGARRMFEESRIAAVYSEVTFLEFDRTHTQFLQVYETLRPYNFVLYGIYEPEGAGDTMYSNALFIQKSQIV
jgi:FkbM family methyltransferase